MHFGCQNIISTDIVRFSALIRAFGNFEPKATSFDPFLAKFTLAEFPPFLGSFPSFLGSINTNPGFYKFSITPKPKRILLILLDLITCRDKNDACTLSTAVSEKEDSTANLLPR